MKNLIFAILLISGCSVADTHRNHHLTHMFSVENNIIYYEGKPFAELQAMTWSLDGGELVREMNFKLLDKTKERQVLGDMIDFLSIRHPGDEIEVEFYVEPGSDDFKL